MVNTQILSPHTAIVSYLSKHQDRIDSLHRNSQSAVVEEYHRDTAEDIQCHIVEMRAILKYATYLALDVCAVLGGMEMPVWPLHPGATSIFFDEAEIAEAVTFAMTLEQWGVPHYRVQGGDPQASISSSAGPLSNAADKAELQLQLRERAKVPSVRKPFSWPCTCFIHCMRNTATPVFPVSDNIENFIREQVVQVLSSDLGTTSVFRVFSDTMQNILQGAWTGVLYEKEHMKSSTTGATWKCIRSPFAVGNHGPLIDPFMRVPYAYHHPDRPLPWHNASIPLVVSASTAIHPMPTMTKDHWFVLSACLSPDVGMRQCPGLLGCQRSDGEHKECNI